jgi:hypothetical protein
MPNPKPALRLQEMGVGVRCAAAVGERLWFGLATGGVRVFETGPKPVLLAHFSAHDSAIVSIAQVGGISLQHFVQSARYTKKQRLVQRARPHESCRPDEPA